MWLHHLLRIQQRQGAKSRLSLLPKVGHSSWHVTVAWVGLLLMGTTQAMTICPWQALSR